jgi:hypothetical protein
MAFGPRRMCVHYNRLMPAGFLRSSLGLAGRMYDFQPPNAATWRHTVHWRQPLMIMRTFSYYAQRTAPLALSGVLVSCSATETTSTAGAGRLTGGSAARDHRAATGDDALIDADGTLAGGQTTSRLGGELYCDGVDENGNGVIDDVDRGNDGLCDCIHLGFFGNIASDAGGATGRFEDWLKMRSDVPFEHLAATATLTAEWLENLQVLIVGGMQQRKSGFSSEEKAALLDWLSERGGGLFTLAGYTADSNDASPTAELLATVGLGYELSSVPSQGVIGQGLAPPVWLDGIVAPEHPTVQGVQEIGVYYGYPVTGDGTVILRAEGYDLAMAKQVGAGRVFAFADEWITQDQTWSGMSQGQSNPCQQPCNEEMSRCDAAENVCANCENQPCSDPKDTDAATCAKGCDQSCRDETSRCEMYAEQCATCTEQTEGLADATPRFWLNSILWLTPESECQIVVPVDLQIK